MPDVLVELDTNAEIIGVLVPQNPIIAAVLTQPTIVATTVTVGPAGPMGPSGVVQIVAVPAASWPPASPQPDTLYLKII